ncbi:DUF4097 family beta strand repeat-containing protein [Chryseomicrobium sp. FSL W7-1435]|uniref:DUF4097 family beta strand repeat-containing protein n=1 Tax=Chryseomicrobium sp. FSL W7-1435 TaxID=2921704 RepID=UPI00315AA912
MQDERKRILDMLEHGQITAQEAMGLLDALSKQQEQTHTQFKEEPTFSKDSNRNRDFIEEAKRDFTVVGERVMQMMQGTVDKIRQFDFENPFGEAVTIKDSYTLHPENLRSLTVDIANGKVEIYSTETNEVTADVTVKSYRQMPEEELRQKLHSDFVFKEDDGRLRAFSDMKTIAVHMTLKIPKQQYDQLTVRLFNGDLTAGSFDAKHIKIKTTNGKVSLHHMEIEEVDIETVNGTVQLKDVNGEAVDVETVNGRIYVEGKIRDLEGTAVNGNLVLTTKHSTPRKLEGSALSGNVELYVPRHVPLKGEASTQLGHLDVQLADVTQSNQSEQFMMKKVTFTKAIEDDQAPLYVSGEAKTGTVVVRYTTVEDATTTSTSTTTTEETSTTEALNNAFDSNHSHDPENR